VVTNEIRSGQIDEWLRILRESVVPALDEQPGFRGFVALVDRDHDTTVGYSVWESAADLAASEQSGHDQQQIAKLSEVLAGPPSRALYELHVLAPR
jgi:quinol monooxygenase YgiN